MHLTGSALYSCTTQPQGENQDKRLARDKRKGEHQETREDDPGIFAINTY